MIDLNSAQSLIAMASGALVLLAAFNRHRIVKHFKRIISALRKTSALVTENEALAEQLAESEQKNIEWESAFDNVDKLRIAISQQLEHLRTEIDEIRSRLSAKDALIGLLQSDRDALLTWGRLLIGQLHAHKLDPEYPSPSLRSIVAIPTAVPDVIPPE